MMRFRVFVAAGILLAVCIVSPAFGGIAERLNEKLKEGVWKADRAMHDIAIQLSFGPRSMGTPGHENAIRYIEGEMRKAKASEIKAQQWVDTGEGQTGRMFGVFRNKAAPHRPMANIVARFNPENPRRVIVGTHYDSIIRAYNDKQDPSAIMPGANNSASGVALLLETARALSNLPPPPVGIDFVFFDGEEGPKSLGAGDKDWYPIGSPYFTRHLEEFYPDAKPEQAIIFDMVCYKKLVLKREPASVASAGAQVQKFWEIGEKIAPKIFDMVPYNYPIEDDHNAFSALGIPSFLVIGFEYEPFFNTTQDTLDKCAASTLGGVGETLVRYLYSL